MRARGLTRCLRVTVDILMFVVLILVVISPYFIRTLTRAWTFLGWNLSTWHQVLGYVFTGLMVLHIVLNFKWLAAVTKNFLKVNTMARVSCIVTFLLFAAMCVSIISGIMWGRQPGPPPPVPFNPYIAPPAAGWGASQSLRVVHIISSWAAVLFTGIHVGIHFSRFITLLLPSQKKSSKPASK